MTSMLKAFEAHYFLTPLENEDDIIADPTGPVRTKF